MVIPDWGNGALLVILFVVAAGALSLSSIAGGRRLKQQHSFLYPIGRKRQGDLKVKMSPRLLMTFDSTCLHRTLDCLMMLVVQNAQLNHTRVDFQLATNFVLKVNRAHKIT